MVYYAFCILGAARSMESLNLNQYRQQNRIIVTYANSDQNAKLSKLRQDIQENSCGFKNRNLLHFHITEPNEDYKILLIGKDGGVKFEGENKTLQQIFNQIDTMPMRRNEMQFDSC